MQAEFGGKRRRLTIYHALTSSVAILLALHSIFAEAGEVLHYDYSLGTDVRRARLNWNIAGSLAGTGPNILSELNWYDLEIAQVSGEMQIIFHERLVLQGRAAYGAVVNGNNRDSDYNGDNRTLEYLRSESEGGGTIGEGSVGFGYHFRIIEPGAGHYLHVTPMLGYSRYIQYLKIFDGRQIIPTPASIADLDSKYDADWSGPWAGLNIRLEADDPTSVIINMEYHWADYYADANWNLRDDLAHPVSFTHSTRGHGFIVSIAVSHAVTKHWELLARMESQHWRANSGIDTLNTIDVSTGVLQPTVTRLNAVNWQSLSGGLAAAYHY